MVGNANSFHPEKPKNKKAVELTSCVTQNTTVEVEAVPSTPKRPRRSFSSSVTPSQAISPGITASQASALLNSRISTLHSGTPSRQNSFSTGSPPSMNRVSSMSTSSPVSKNSDWDNMMARRRKEIGASRSRVRSDLAVDIPKAKAGAFKDIQSSFTQRLGAASSYVGDKIETMKNALETTKEEVEPESPTEGYMDEHGDPFQFDNTYYQFNSRLSLIDPIKFFAML